MVEEGRGRSRLLPEAGHKHVPLGQGAPHRAALGPRDPSPGVSEARPAAGSCRRDGTGSLTLPGPTLGGVKAMCSQLPALPEVSKAAGPGGASACPTPSCWRRQLKLGTASGSHVLSSCPGLGDTHHTGHGASAGSSHGHHPLGAAQGPSSRRPVHCQGPTGCSPH